MSKPKFRAGQLAKTVKGESIRIITSSTIREGLAKRRLYTYKVLRTGERHTGISKRLVKSSPVSARATLGNFRRYGNPIRHKDGIDTIVKDIITEVEAYS